MLDAIDRMVLVKKLKQKIFFKNATDAGLSFEESTDLLLLDSIDNYIEHRIQADKKLKGLLREINEGVRTKC